MCYAVGLMKKEREADGAPHPFHDSLRSPLLLQRRKIYGSTTATSSMEQMQCSWD